MTQRMTLQEYRNRPERVRKPHNHHESDHQKTFFEVLKRNMREFPFLYFIFAPPNGANRSKTQAWNSKQEGQRAGVPDIIFPFQRRGYPGAYMENKFGKNMLTKDQEKFRDHLLSEGYCYKLCYTADQQIEFTEWYLGIELVK